jgi:hypothetical protein
MTRRSPVAPASPSAVGRPPTADRRQIETEQEVDRSDHPQRALRILFVALLLYAALGKGFAYAGWSPVFVGELLLVVVVAGAVRSTALLPRNGAAVVTGGLVAAAVVQCAVDRLANDVPLLETVRGLAVVYYCMFAFGAYALLREWEARAGRERVLETVESSIMRALPFVASAVLVLAVLLLIEPSWLPTWPGSGVPVVLTKPGDIAVTLVFFTSILRSRRLLGRLVARNSVLAMLAMTALLVAVRSRGALLTLVVGLVVARPRADRVAKGVLAAISVMLVLYVSGLRLSVGHREFSYDGVTDAVASVLGTEPEDEIGSNYVGTRNWRADWWQAIWHDAVADRMLLHGHGWGDNLAVRYDVVPPPAADDPRVLRLPHSLFFSLVGRAGVLFAVVFLLVPVLTIATTYRSHPLDRSPTVEAARGAVAAAVATALFGIYIESPQGGIVFWSLIGFLWWTVAPTRRPTTVGQPRGS